MTYSHLSSSSSSTDGVLGRQQASLLLAPVSLTTVYLRRELYRDGVLGSLWECEAVEGLPRRL